MVSFMFRDWFFERLIWCLVSESWVVKIKDFKKSKKKSERKFFGLSEPKDEDDSTEGIIYLDIDHATPRILVHELGHVILGETLYIEARERNKTEKKINEWAEDQVMIFERYFFECLTKQQKRALKVFVDRAQIEFKHRG